MTEVADTFRIERPLAFQEQWQLVVAQQGKKLSRFWHDFEQKKGRGPLEMLSLVLGKDRSTDPSIVKLQKDIAETVTRVDTSTLEDTDPRELAYQLASQLKKEEQHQEHLTAIDGLMQKLRSKESTQVFKMFKEDPKLFFEQLGRMLAGEDGAASANIITTWFADRGRVYGNPNKVTLSKGTSPWNPLHPLKDPRLVLGIILIAGVLMGAPKVMEIAGGKIEANVETGIQKQRVESTARLIVDGEYPNGFKGILQVKDGGNKEWFENQIKTIQGWLKEGKMLGPDGKSKQFSMDDIKDPDLKRYLQEQK
ncbi:hypothetical protein HY388_01500 [Candidatus Daviesbacteria bacterium]|nr:hypothetical protein [Candidatus Daviesbacteria bacterium]